MIYSPQATERVGGISMKPAGDGSHLLRVLGVAFGIAAVIGGTIGQGILRSPGLVAQGIPDARLIIALWILGGVVAMIDAMSTVELAASIRRAGGNYAFTRRAYGPKAGPAIGLATGLADWLGYVGVCAFLGVVFGEYLHRLGIGTSVPIGVLAATLILIIGSIQTLGTRIAGASQELGSAIKALIFGAFIVALFFAPRAAPVASMDPVPALTAVGVIVAMRAIVGTYLGWNTAAVFCEEVKDPARSIPRAIFSGIALVTLIYVLMNVAFLQVLTPAEMAGSPLVAADAAARVFGPSADTFVTAISLISLLTILNMALMTLPRAIFAMARDRGVTALSHVAKNGTPIGAAILMTSASALMATVGVYEILLAFSVTLTTTVAACINVAAIVLRRREPDLERPYRMPFFPLPALFALLVNGGLLIAFLYEGPAISLQAYALLAVVTVTVLFLTRRTAAQAQD